MTNLNCWEYKKCGREVGGKNIKDLGVCPAATFVLADNFCGGENGGRACAYVTGTFCAGSVNGTFQDKAKNCVKCDFYKSLKMEHPYEANVLQFHKLINSRAVKPENLAIA